MTMLLRVPSSSYPPYSKIQYSRNFFRTWMLEGTGRGDRVNHRTNKSVYRCLSSSSSSLSTSPSIEASTARTFSPGSQHDSRRTSPDIPMSSTTTIPSLTLGLLRENYDKWERRAPLTPDQCQDFLRDHPGSKIVVQPSSHRIFSNAAYEEAGAIVKEDLDQAHVILGVKRPRSMEALPSNKTYMFFSHVIKVSEFIYRLFELLGLMFQNSVPRMCMFYRTIFLTLYCFVHCRVNLKIW
jgi:hypothetical protein